jgi:hypothetical protein
MPNELKRREALEHRAFTVFFCWFCEEWRRGPYGLPEEIKNLRPSLPDLCDQEY